MLFTSSTMGNEWTCSMSHREVAAKLGLELQSLESFCDFQIYTACHILEVVSLGRTETEEYMKIDLQTL